MKDLKKNFLPFFSILALTLIFFWKVIVNGLVPLPADIITGGSLPWRDYYSIPIKNPIVSDAISFTYPMRTLGIDLIKEGKLPLWNPYILSGTPLLANFQSAPFSPSNIFYFLTDTLTAWSLQVMVQHLLAGIFLYMLLRHWKASRFASVVGGISFAFGGFITIWSQWNAHSLATAFIPLALLLTDKLLLEKKYRYGTGLSLVIFAQILSGYPQIVIYTLLALGALWIIRPKENTFGLALFLALGLGLATFQALPAYELISLSQRAAEPIPLNWVFLYPKEIITFLAPDFFGNHATGNYWGYKNYLGTVGFIGVVPFILAVVGLVKTKRSEVKILWLMIVFALVLAFKNPLSLFWWEKNILGLSAGVFYKSLSIFIVAVSVAVGFGVDFLKGKRLLWPTLPVYLILGGWTVYAVKIRNQVAVDNLVLPIFFLFAVSFLLIFRGKFKLYILGILLVAELFAFGWRFTPFVEPRLVFPTTRVIDFLQKQRESEVFRVSGGDIIAVNNNMPYKLEFLGGYDAVYPYLAAKFIGVLNSNDSGAAHQDRFGIVNNVGSRLTNLLNMKYLLVKSDADYDEKRFKEVFTDRSISVLENKEVLPRQFEVTDWEVVSGEKETLDRLLDPAFPLGKKIVLDTDPGDISKMLFVSDTYYPGWKAFIDGREVPIYRADYAFRAIPVPEGDYDVDFKYQPKSFTTGLKVSSISFLVLIAFWILF
ncbi:hypothetical protein A2630_02450 [Candidatus Woesebacteria bacterium RIFCSPHIGHO2_01_FULL_44_10]|nr:MAG: hypothetical protein A2630_02450 [Candidatus Woesebacteria bacterium RIFCSPHIGHO2_01_FULL_44_10]